MQKEYSLPGHVSGYGKLEQEQAKDLRDTTERHR